MRWTRAGYEIDTDPARLDLATVLRLIETAYWGGGLGEARIRRSLEHALCFGLYASDGRQVGFARVVSDMARFAWLSDVVLEPDCRGRGLGLWLVQTVLEHEPLRDVRRWLLSTADAHDFYARLGFAPADARRLMHRLRPE